MIEEQEFNEYVEKFKKMPISKKKEVTVKEMKKLVAFVTLLKDKCGAPKEILYNREILDTNNENFSEEDFVEAVFVYANIIKEAFSEYVSYTLNDKEDL